jgi:hypothetical protein
MTVTIREGSGILFLVIPTKVGIYFRHGYRPEFILGPRKRGPGGRYDGQEFQVIEQLIDDMP